MNGKRGGPTMGQAWHRKDSLRRGAEAKGVKKLEQEEERLLLTPTDREGQGVDCWGVKKRTRVV